MIPDVVMERRKEHLLAQTACPGTQVVQALNYDCGNRGGQVQFYLPAVGPKECDISFSGFPEGFHSSS